MLAVRFHFRFFGNTAVMCAHAAVKTAAVSEKAADAAEGRRMVSELDDFDSRR